MVSLDVSLKGLIFLSLFLHKNSKSEKIRKGREAQTALSLPGVGVLNPPMCGGGCEMTIYLDTMVQFGNLLPYGMGNDDECHPLDEIDDLVTEADILRFYEEEEVLIRRLDGELPPEEEEPLAAERDFDPLRIVA